MAAVMGAGWLGPRLGLRGLEAQVLADAGAVEGETLRLHVTVRNTTATSKQLLTFETSTDPLGAAASSHDKPLPRPANALDGSTTWFCSELGPGGAVHYQSEVRARRRGVFGAPVVRASTAAPFGLFERTQVLVGRGELVVAPAPWTSAASLRLAGRTARGVQALRGRGRGESDELHRLRDYQSGDDIRHMHWPSSARAGRLIVRELEAADPISVHIVIDSSPLTAAEGAHLSALDACARVVAGWLLRSSRVLSTVTLHTQGSSLQVAGRRSGEQAGEWLARLEPATQAFVRQGKGSWLEVVRACVATLPSHSHLWVAGVTPDWDEDVAAVLAQRRITCTCVGIDPQTFLEQASEEEPTARSPREALEATVPQAWQSWLERLAACGAEAEYLTRDDFGLPRAAQGEVAP
jgi:uncharacterized protein (DUF58 family)